MRSLFFGAAVLLLFGGCSGPQSADTSEPFIPNETWADAQLERALSDIPNRDVPLAQSLFDEGWNPYYSFPQFDVFAGEVSLFNWRSRAWQRTNLNSYLDGDATWQDMFSLSNLPSDGTPYWPRPWVNLICNSGFSGRCMIAVTQAGFDEIKWVEIDAETGRLPEDGFNLPAARASVDWMDDNRLLVAIGTNDKDTGPTGYPLTVRVLQRGESLSDAEVVYRAPETADAVNVNTGRSADTGFRIVTSSEGARVVDVKFIHPDGYLIPLDIPVDVVPLGVHGQNAIIALLEDWAKGDVTWQAGSVIAFDLQDQKEPELLLDASTDRWVNSSWPSLFTPESIYMAVLENGAQSIYQARRASGSWQLDRVLGDGQRIAQLVTGDPAGTSVFATIQTALDEPSLLQIQNGEVVQEVRKSRSYFAIGGLEVERLTAKATDGVEIPYWRISDSTRTPGISRPPPTILYGYGASNSPTLPEYNAEAGRLWIKKGGAYVVAQVRGGGEYGPNWHNDGYGDNRDVPLQDFIAIAEDLVARGLARPQSLGLDGTSDGGRLVAGAALLRPDLFAAVVSRDGAVYVEAGFEGGSPILANDLDLLNTKEGRQLADRYWPDRLLDEERGCAPMLLTSWRGDQRVPVTQSRAFAAKLLEADCDVLLIEREGGNHATTDAELLASVYGYFSDRLGLAVAETADGSNDGAN